MEIFLIFLTSRDIWCRGILQNKWRLEWLINLARRKKLKAETHNSAGDLIVFLHSHLKVSKFIAEKFLRFFTLKFVNCWSWYFRSYKMKCWLLKSLQYSIEPGYLLRQRSWVRLRHLPQWSWCATGSLWNNLENLKAGSQNKYSINILV